MTLEMYLNDRFKEGKEQGLIEGKQLGLTEGVEKGKKQGLEQGTMIGVVKLGRSLQWTDEQIISKLIEIFNVSRESAGKILESESGSEKRI